MDQGDICKDNVIVVGTDATLYTKILSFHTAYTISSSHQNIVFH